MGTKQKMQRAPQTEQITVPRRHCIHYLSTRLPKACSGIKNYYINKKGRKTTVPPAPIFYKLSAARNDIRKENESAQDIGLAAQDGKHVAVGDDVVHDHIDVQLRLDIVLHIKSLLYKS